jgi:hypothetical protein
MSEVNGGQYPQSSGSPIFPGSTFTGPLLAGNVSKSDGTGFLAGVGETSGTANVGYAVMAQTVKITQASNAATTIVIPAQSQIVAIDTLINAAWTGAAKTFGVGTTVSATALTTAGAVDGSALGRIVATPGTATTQINNWIDVGNTDVQVVVTNSNTGTGVGYLTVRYVQGINLVP